MPIPRKLSRSEQQKRTAKSRRLREAFAPHVKPLKTAERGELAEFKLFGLVATVWLAAQRHLPRKPPQDEAAWQVEHERTADLAIGGRQLGKRLVEALMKNDPATFRNVAATIELLRKKPFVGERFAPFERIDQVILRYAESQGMKPIRDMRPAIAKKMRWPLDPRGQLIPAHEKLLRNHIRKLGLKLPKSKPGPTRKS